MDRVNENSVALAAACYGESSMVALTTVMEALKSTIEAENEILSLGFPPKATLGQRKEILAEEYQQLLGNIGVADGIEIDDPAIQGRLRAANDELRVLSNQNSELLNRAVSATRRRVEAVMEAIRACDAGAFANVGTGIASSVIKNDACEA